MESGERAIRRERRILGRAVRRGEQPASVLAEFEARHPGIFPPREPEPETKTPFMLPDGRPLDLRGLYRGGALFIVLSGPSLLTLDLGLFERRGVVTFGVNNSPAVVRTDFVCHVDPPRKFHDAIWRDASIVKFCPTRLLQRQLNTRGPDGKIVPLTRLDGGQSVPVRPCDLPGTIGYERNAYFNPATWLSENSVNWGSSRKSSQKTNQPRCLNTMFAVMKLAYLLGFRVVYLAGVDFRMDPARPYAFEQHKSGGGVESNNNGYAVMNQMFDQLRPSFEAAGFHVFNTNPTSGLLTFPHVPFKTAIESVTSGVAQDPIDCRGWYEAEPDEQEED